MSTTRLFSTSALAASALLALTPAAWAQASAASTAASAAALPVTVDHDNLWNLAARVAPVRGATRQQVMVALLRLNPQAFVQGNMHRLRRGMPLTVPSAQEIAAEDPARAEQLVQAHLLALDKGAPVPVLPRLAVASASGMAAVTPPARAAAAAASVPASSPAGAAAVPAPATPASVMAPPPAPLTPASAPSPVPTLPAPSAATAASQVAEPLVQPAPVVPQAESGSPSPVVRWLPYALAVVLAGGAVLMWQRRRSRERFNDSVMSSFFDENGVRRPSRPKVIDVSQAGVETARTVETLQSAAELVRDSASSVMPLQPADDPYRETALKLEIARTCLEVGRTEAARLMLQIVRREGSAAQQLLAGDLLDRLAPA
jgi:FimV-like protein